MTEARTPISPPTDADLQPLLEKLYANQLALDPNDPYMRTHGNRTAIENHVRTFRWYRPYLPNSGVVLDWGCNHAPDSCLLRASFGDRLSLHSCDFGEPSRYRLFHDFARTEHHRLESEVLLPFSSNFFDAVVGSGVLEHAAMDYESLKELHRVIKPDGVLVISYLPNWLSINEWMRRVIRKKDFHRRLYGMGETTQLLKRCGFYPIAAGYQTFVWERMLTAAGLRRWERGLAECLAWLLPIHVFGSTLYLAGRKVSVF